MSSGGASQASEMSLMAGTRLGPHEIVAPLVDRAHRSPRPFLPRRSIADAVAAAAMLSLFISCRSTPLPPLPDVSTAPFLPAIRQSVEAAVAEAKSHPEDANAVGRLGMVLHA